MPGFLRILNALSASIVVLMANGALSRAAEPVRANAVVSLTFDEANGKPMVSIAGMPQPAPAELVNGPARVASPFWNQSGKGALRFDAARKQFVRLSDLPYLDRPDALTLSLFYLNLHPATDAAAHGIVAKRSGEGRGTNYGINYAPSTDVFQVYVNDGRGFRIASYSARQVLGSRRLVHLIATLEVGDAPAPDADTDRDDVLVRLFVNGEPVAPKSVAGGDVSGSDAWFTNVNIAGLLNDAPLTIGASAPELEPASGVVDEFLLFARALSPAEAQRLFQESAGPNGTRLARRELELKPTDPPPPSITSLSQFGLQIGGTTRLTIQGANLAPSPQVDLPISGLTQTVVAGSNAARLVVDIAVPAGVPPGIYPLSVITGGGVSKSAGIAVDGLPQRLIGESAPDRQAILPAAYSGLLSGAAQSRVYFHGKAGARVVAEVEAKRIGSMMEPVLEVKIPGRRSLAIEWGKAYLRGDARAEVVLPADGDYVVELHDLAYNAPPESPYRLLVGDFRAVDAYFPAVVPRGSRLDVEPVGTGIPMGTLIAANLEGDRTGRAALLLAPQALHASGPLPPLRISDGLEILEVAQPAQQLQTVDARFASKPIVPLAINGRLTAPDETDRYLLAVTPARPLKLTVDGRSLNSPVEGHLSLYSHPGGKLLAADGGTPGAAAAGFQFTPPADVAQVEVAVRDLLGRGGRHFVYRLRIAPADQPTFSLALMESRLNIPRDGRTIAQLRVDRSGYGGPIALKVEGDEPIAVAPAQLPAETTTRNVMLTFTAAGNKPMPGVRRLRLVGESVGVEPVIRQSAVMAGPGQSESARFIDQVPAASRGTSNIRVDVPASPSVVLKGVDAQWPITVSGKPGSEADWLQLSLTSTETIRTQKVEGRERNRPRILAAPEQAIRGSDGKGTLKVDVPLDIAEPMIDFVIRADVVPHAYSDQVLATTFSNPFRVMVQDAASLNVDGQSLTLVGGAMGKIHGKIARHPDYKGNVTVQVAGLPPGYAAKPVTVPPDKADFEIPVTAGAEAAARTLPNVSITVSLDNGKTPINQPIELKVAPPAKK